MFRRYLDEEGSEYFVSLCGKQEEPRFVQLVDTFADVTCSECQRKR